MFSLIWRTESLILKSYKPRLSGIKEGTTLKYQKFWMKYLMMILKTMLLRFVADIEGCHRLPLGRNNTTDKKRVIVKFVNRKHSKLKLRSKKSISMKSKVYINHSLCPYYCYIWAKCKDLQRKGKVSQVFCLGMVVTIRVTENAPPSPPLHENSSQKGPKGYSRMPPQGLK